MTIWKDPFKNLKGITNYLILNLAASDLLIGILADFFIGIPVKVLSKQRAWHRGFCASGLTILGLAAERLIVISNPFKSANYLTYTNLTRGILCIWILAGLRAILSVCKWASIEKDSVIISDSLSTPVLTLTVACYARILFLVRKGPHRDLTTEADCEERQRLIENAREREKIKGRERRVMRCVVILVGLFIVCWAPCVVVGNIAQSCEKKRCCYWHTFVHSRWFNLPASGDQSDRLFAVLEKVSACTLEDNMQDSATVRRQYKPLPKTLIDLETESISKQGPYQTIPLFPVSLPRHCIQP